MVFWSCLSNSRLMISTSATLTLEFLLFDADSNPNWYIFTLIMPQSYYAASFLRAPSTIWIQKITFAITFAWSIFFWFLWLCGCLLVLFAAMAYILPLDRALGLSYWLHLHFDSSFSPSSYLFFAWNNSVTLFFYLLIFILSIKHNLHHLVYLFINVSTGPRKYCDSKHSINMYRINEVFFCILS